MTTKNAKIKQAKAALEHATAMTAKVKQVASAWESGEEVYPSSEVVYDVCCLRMSFTAAFGMRIADAIPMAVRIAAEEEEAAMRRLRFVSAEAT